MADLERVPLKTKIGYGAGHILNDMCASMWFSYLLLFFHKVLQFDNVLSGVILLIGQLADGASTVFVGYFSDTKDDIFLCNKIGKRKSWHLVGSICVLFSFPFIFVPCINCTMSHQSAQMVYYAAFVIIFQFGWAATQISHLASIPDIASSQNERTGLTAIRYSMTVFSNILVYLIAWGLFDESQGRENMIGPNDAPAFRTLMSICLGVGIVATIIYHFTVKINETESEDTNDLNEPSGTSVLKWFKEGQLYQIAVVYMATRLFVNLTQAYVPLYLQVSLQLPAKYVATVPLTMYISGFVTSFTMKKTNHLLGRKATYIIGALTGISGSLWVEFGCNPDSDYTKFAVYMVAAILGVGSTIMLVTSLALTAEFIGSDTNSSAFIYGLMSLTDKVSNGLAVVLIQNFIPTKIDTCIKCRLYFRDVILYACGGSALLGIFGVLSLLKTTVGTRRNLAHLENEPLNINEGSDERTPLI